MTTTALARVSELDRYMAEVSRFPLLSAEEEQRLARRWRDEGDVEAAHTLVTANLRFVVKVANEYRGYGTRVLDLVQEGSVGLMQAVKRFDPDRGYRLLTYAVYWIRSYIHNFLMATSRMVRIGGSRAHRKLFFKLRALKGKLAAGGTTDREGLLDAVAVETGVDREQVAEMDQLLTTRDTSLDTPVGESGTALAELMPASGPNQEDLVGDLEESADRAARIDAAMESLDPRERRVIEARYLLEEPRQLQEIGDEMGVTKQRVSQLERRALAKLRAAVDAAA
ncbi:MAG: RNA polymerase factor sigma-32 [Deltaproteobacteria bacterium]|jgi:RNA polymerase sigma-32 factor|nr:RNA polymerase factor sigma-32 [Deltaproteobacteria bacterium]